MYFLLCPRQGLKIEDGVLHRVYILGLFCPKQGQALKPSAAPLYPTIGQVPPPPPGIEPIVLFLVLQSVPTKWTSVALYYVVEIFLLYTAIQIYMYYGIIAQYEQYLIILSNNKGK